MPVEVPVEMPVEMLVEILDKYFTHAIQQERDGYFQCDFLNSLLSSSSAYITYNYKVF